MASTIDKVLKRTKKIKTQIISSQDYLDPDIVAVKCAEKDFHVLLTPEFEYEGRNFRVVLDGHHSLAAAKISHQKPVFTTANPNNIEGFELVNEGDRGVAEFLRIHYNGADWWNIATGGPATWS